MKLTSILMLLTLGISYGNDTRPNILFFFADDWGRHAGVYANPQNPSISDVLKTPYIDSIANEGVLFENAFTQVASCGPSRASIATGRSFWRNGSHVFKGDDLFTKENDPYTKLPNFVNILTSSGYHAARSGKTIHFSASKGVKLEPMPDFLTNGTFNNAGLYPRYGKYVGLAKTADEREKKHNEVGQAVRELTRRAFASVPEGKPFFYIAGPINTHRPYITDSGKDIWGIDPERLKGRIPHFLPDVKDVRRDFGDYAGEIQALDFKLGIILEELEKTGKMDNTIIILSGDHGMPGVPRGKTTCYDFGVRVPLLIRYPKMIAPGRKVKDFVTLTDLAPTLLEIAGQKIPDSMDSKSFFEQLKSPNSGWIDEERDYVITGRERHVGHARAGNLAYPMRAVRTKDFLYIRNFKPERTLYGDASLTYTDMDSSLTKSYILNNKDEEDVRKYFSLHFERQEEELLYRAKNDQYFLKNLVDNPEMSPELQRLKTLLLKKMQDTGDLRLEDGYDQLPWTGPFIKTEKKKKGYGKP